MLIKPDDGGETYDRFRGRLMIPIRDARGRVIAFGGRILGDGEPKYLNSPRDPALRQGPHALQYRPRLARQPRRQAADRRRRLYGRHRARPRRDRGGRRPERHRASPKRSWSGCGGSIRRPLLCFDGDAAGQKASIRAALRALPHARARAHPALRRPCPPGQDPDDVVKNGGRAAFEALLDAAEPLVERLWRHERDAAPLDHPRRARRR